jgi:heat shock protein HslJ
VRQERQRTDIACAIEVNTEMDTIQKRIRQLLGSSLICLVVSCAFAALSSPLAALDDAVPGGAVSSSLEGHQWRLSQFYVGNKSLITLPLRVPIPYFAFRDGKIVGSAGCGQFTGIYRGTDDQLAISASWADDNGSPCNGEQKDEAAKILHALASVRRIRPAYDALLLQDENGVLQVRLVAMQPGKDLSELHDTFWHLNQLEGSTADFSQVVINIDEIGITFSTPSYLIGIPFQYHLLTGLQFYPAYTKGGDTKSSNYSQDQQVAEAYEDGLHKIDSYELKQETLTFFDKDRQPIMVFSSLLSRGIENRIWRIAKERAVEGEQTDNEGLIDKKMHAYIVLMNGRVSGNSGCGGFVGTYKLSGDVLTLHAGTIVTGTGCTDLNEPYKVSNVSNRKDPYNSELLVEQRGDQIILRDKSGQAQILLVPF